MPSQVLARLTTELHWPCRNGLPLYFCRPFDVKRPMFLLLLAIKARSDVQSNVEYPDKFCTVICIGPLTKLFISFSASIYSDGFVFVTFTVLL